MMTHDDAICAHGLESLRGVLEAFTLRNARSFGCKADYVGRQAFCGKLERDPRSGRILEKQVNHGATPKGRQLLYLAIVYLGHLFG